MANIKVTIDYPIVNGQPLTFKSPTDCSQVTGLTVCYSEGGTNKSKTFQFADAHGNNVGSIDLFASNVLVKVILDVDASKAYVQNADTNAYLEGRFDGKVNKDGDTLTGVLQVNSDGGAVSAMTFTYNGEAQFRNRRADNTFSTIILPDGNTDKPLEYVKLRNGATVESGKILHTGNKPTGTYTGHGDSPVRDIQTGGDEGLIYIVAGTVISIIGYQGGIGINPANGTIQTIPKETARFYGGALHFGASTVYGNTQSTSCTYYVL